LHLGTRKENRLDTIRKGRAKAPRGANSPAAKFTDEQVREIRAKYSKEKRIGYRTLAKEYGVSATTILRIIRNETYVKSNYTPPR
jgi:DNA invertase Pin-like site-specific DNA recombinase